MYYGKQLREIVSNLTQLADLPDKLSGIAKKIEEHAEVLRIVQEKRQQQENIRQEWQSEILSLLKNSDLNKTADSAREYRVQNSVRRATWWAFIAAVIYASISLFQWNTMNRTYREITEQTKAAKDAAYAACVGTQVSRSALIEVVRGETFASEAADAARIQAVMATRSQVAYIVPVFDPTPMFVKAGQPFAVLFNFKNAGNSTAKNVKARFKVSIVPREQDTYNFAYPEKYGFVEVSELLAGRSPASVDLPGGGMAPVLDKSGNIATMTDDDEKSWKFGFKDVIFTGRITYSDIAGVAHWRNICQVVTSPENPNGMRHPGCFRYNQEDQSSGVPNPTQPRLPIADVPEIRCEAPKSEN